MSEITMSFRCSSDFNHKNMSRVTPQAPQQERLFRFSIQDPSGLCPNPPILK